MIKIASLFSGIGGFEKGIHQANSKTEIVFASEIDPYARRNKKKEPYIRKNGREIHKTIVENKIGRKLNKGEIIHHIDLDKRNNKESNLHLCKDRTTHNGCHHSLELVAAQLIKTKHIVFENGRYKNNI